MKKFFSIFLAVAMLCMMALPTFAGTSTYTLTITNAAGHTYDVYQIFTGDLSTEGEKTVLSNVKYGQSYGESGAYVPKDTLDKLKVVDDLLNLVKDEVSSPIMHDVTPAEGETFVKIEGLESGYYMVVDVSTDLPDGDTKSTVILQVVEDVTIASKHAGITSYKKVDDKNDSNSAEDPVHWQDSADYDFGDAVPFKLSATIPSTYAAYQDYTIVFHDMQAAGFDNPVITSVYVANANGEKINDIPKIEDDVTNGYSLTTGACDDSECEFGENCSFSVEVGDLNDLVNGYAEGMQIVVEYTSILNDGAVVGSIGNENGMYVSHPDGHTPTDYVIVFTYEITGNKIDGATEAPLKGAGFTLYKWDHDAGADGEWVAVGEELKGDDKIQFTWSGIDDGKYKLVETTTPTGYNTMAPIEFEITAGHMEEWTKDGSTSAFQYVTATNTAGDVFVDAVDLGSGKMETDGKLVGTLVNNKGTVLPETGAMGTMIFVTVGALLAMVAVVFMVTRKKMSVYED